MNATKRMTLKQANETYKGKTVHWGNLTGVVEKVGGWHYGKKDWALVVKKDHAPAKGGEYMIPFACEVEIILGYVISMEELLKHAEK
jgi:hypothetical protein